MRRSGSGGSGIPIPLSKAFTSRAVDDEGEVLDLLVQRRRDKAAAVKLMRKLIKKQGFALDVLVTDKLRSYGAAKGGVGIVGSPRPGLTREQSGWREFASADTTGRAQDAAFQIARISPTLLVHSRRRPKHSHGEGQVKSDV